MFLHPINIKEGLDSEKNIDCSQCPQQKKEKTEKKEEEPPSNNELFNKINNLSTQVNVISGQLNTTTETAENNKIGIDAINAKIKKFTKEITKNMKKESRK